MSTYRCRGVRKWCGRRCEAATAVEPPGYPLQGYFCALHRYQEPKQTPSGLKFDSPEVETHIRRKTSFLAPESQVASELLKSAGTVRDGKSATGSAIVSWLQEKKGMSLDSAMNLGTRMVELDILMPKDGGPKVFSSERSAIYFIHPSAGVGGGSR